jgi:N-carbamoylputrescine amidase
VAGPSTFKIGLVQMRCSADPDDNLRRARARIDEAAGRGAQLVCLPELFRSQYFCQSEDHANFDLAEPIPGPSTAALAETARDKKVVIVASLFERRAAGVYHNTAVIIDADGKLLGSYRKMHIPDDPLYYEKFYFTPGDLGFRAFDTACGRIGTLVCWDQWYPEGARLTALAGADVLFYPTAIGWHPSEKAEFGAGQAAAVNRIGFEKPAGVVAGDGIEFWGGSFVADPFGQVMAEATRDSEETLIVTVDRRHQETVRRNWPFLRDRRIDAYGPITRRLLDE